METRWALDSAGLRLSDLGKHKMKCSVCGSVVDEEDMQRHEMECAAKDGMVCFFTLQLWVGYGHAMGTRG